MAEGQNCISAVYSTQRFCMQPSQDYLRRFPKLNICYKYASRNVYDDSYIDKAWITHVFLGWVTTPLQISTGSSHVAERNSVLRMLCNANWRLKLIKIYCNNLCIRSGSWKDQRLNQRLSNAVITANAAGKYGWADPNTIFRT